MYCVLIVDPDTGDVHIHPIDKAISNKYFLKDGEKTPFTGNLVRLIRFWG